jgi:hypothetical protein
MTELTKLYMCMKCTKSYTKKQYARECHNDRVVAYLINLSLWEEVNTKKPSPSAGNETKE